jgi:hypothetical protein
MSHVRREHLDNLDVDKKVLNGIIVQSGVNTFTVMDWPRIEFTVELS